MDEPKIHPSEYLEFSTTTTTLERHNPRIVASDNVSSPLSLQTSRSHDAAAYTDPRNSLHQDQETFNASKREHRMTFGEGLQLYPKAVGWSILISMAIIMEGFDTALINSLYAFGEFRRTYGILTTEGGYQITEKWQTSLSNGAVAGSIIGLFANGILTERFGYRHTMIGALLALAVCIFLVFFAVNIQMLLAGQVLSGLSWGVFSTLTTTYAAEVVPLNLRGYLTANVNMCWLIGQIIAAGTLRGLIDWRSTWSFRIPFGLQWAWIVVLLVIALLAPESPWWLVRNSRLNEAERMLKRLTRQGYGFDAKSTVAVMEFTNITEIKMNGSRPRDISYRQCFRGTNLRRTEIACVTFMIQNLSGLPVISFAAYFYNRIGFSQRLSFDIYVGMQSLAIVAGFCAIPLMKYFGRRTLYLAGLFLQLIVLLAAGIVGIFEETDGTLWATAALVMLFIFIFDCAVGPLTYCIVAEAPSTRLRVKTVVLARVSYNVCALITNIFQTHMLNPIAWDWRAKSCFFWAGACALCFVYCYFRLPEFRGLSYLEIDILFEKRAAAKQFSVFQQRLAETGYFSFREQETREPQWTDACSSPVLKSCVDVEQVRTESKG